VKWRKVSGEGNNVISKEPATLLAESLGQPGCDDSRGFRVKLTDFMASMVVFSMGKISIASFSLTS
jgi:hypothetical protein